MRYSVKVIRSKRKTISIEVDYDANVIVRAPYRTPDKVIDRLLEDKADWIAYHVEKGVRRKNMSDASDNAATVQPFTADEIKELVRKARQILPVKVEKYAKALGVTYGRITIRKQKTLWGSCSSNGNLNFNCLLMLLPEEIIDYVVVHELCHRLQMNHSKAFWNEVEKLLPDYKRRRKILKTQGADLMRKNR